MFKPSTLNEKFLGLLLSAFVASELLGFGWCAMSTHADSEASSEAGSESGAFVRRGRRRYYQQQMMNQRREQQRENKANQKQMRQQRRALNQSPEIREWGNAKQNRHGRINQNGQGGQLGQFGGRQSRLGQSGTGPAASGQTSLSAPSSDSGGAIPSIVR